MRYLLGALLLGATLAGLQPASAYVMDVRQAPWCAVMNYGTGSMYWDCSYATIEACTPNVIAGNRGFCNRNPRGRAGPAPEAPRSVPVNLSRTGRLQSPGRYGYTTGYGRPARRVSPPDAGVAQG